MEFKADTQDRRRSVPLCAAWRRVCLSGVLCLSLCGVSVAGSGNTVRTQVLQLAEGWNSVYLEVAPAPSDPTEVFSGTPIDTVVAPLATGQTEQFASDPSVNRMRLEGWAAWYEPGNPQAFLGTLHAVLGNQAYLVHSREAFAWSVSGEVRHATVLWRPDQYNLVGFSVMGDAAPTFAQFFEGSEAHRDGLIYRMVNGSWRKVLDPSAQTMRSGEAFWIFCNGPSKYQGPLRAVPNSFDGMLLDLEVGTLSLYNDTLYPVGVTLDHIAGAEPASPLSIIVQTVHAEEPQLRSQAVDQPAADWSLDLPPIEAGRSQGVPLQARLEDMTQAEQSSLLRITTDIGTEVWLPVDCLRKDLVEE